MHILLKRLYDTNSVIIIIKLIKKCQNESDSLTFRFRSTICKWWSTKQICDITFKIWAAGHFFSKGVNEHQAAKDSRVPSLQIIWVKRRYTEDASIIMMILINIHPSIKQVSAVILAISVAPPVLDVINTERRESKYFFFGYTQFFFLLQV